MSRIHFVVEDARKVRYQNQAAREQKSLGAWLREAAEAKLASSQPERFSSAREFDEFLAKCQELAAAAPGPDREPDWEETKKVILDARSRGLEALVGPA